MYDLDLVPNQEYAKKLINQGMIQGVIEYIHLIKAPEGDTSRVFVSADRLSEYPDDEFAQIPVHVDFVSDYGQEGSYLDDEGIQKFLDWRTDYAQATFIKNATGQLVTKSEVGKMSKRYFNVVNPDDVVERYGADCFRLFEMFLGPIEQAKPWNTGSISGVSRFLNGFWRLFYKDEKWLVTSDEASPEEMKILHTAIKKVSDDIERFSFNTCVSAFMVAARDLGKINCHKKAILEPLIVLMAPYAVHLCEELWQKLGNEGSVHHGAWPVLDEKWLVEDSVTYPIAINGKTRVTIDFPADSTRDDLMKAAPDLPEVQKYLEGKTIRKVIVVPGRMINLVVG